MLQAPTLSKRLLAGIVGLGATATLVACTNPSSVSADQSPTATNPGMEDSTYSSETGTATEPTDMAANAGTITDLVSENESFNTLETALQAAGLDSTLNGAGPYTVFAPTDEAFAALPPGTLDQLLQPENQALLQQILTYHVVPGGLTSESIQPGDVETVAGEPVTIEADAGELTVSGARVIQPDVQASNGVVHAIDQVLIPPGLQLQ